MRRPNIVHNHSLNSSRKGPLCVSVCVCYWNFSRWWPFNITSGANWICTLVDLTCKRSYSQVNPRKELVAVFKRAVLLHHALKLKPTFTEALPGRNHVRNILNRQRPSYCHICLKVDLFNLPWWHYVLSLMGVLLPAMEYVRAKF